jgi:hypothetical protein
MDRRKQLITQHASRTGLRGKVNAKCIDCIFDPHGGGGSWRQQVEACTSTTCPLYEVRPTSSTETGDEYGSTAQ